MKIIINRIVLSLVTVLLLLQACNKTNRSGISPSEVIPEDDMIEILTDLYIAEGILNYPPLRSDYREKDSTQNYIDVIQKHGYTKALVDSSMRYYFIDRPNKYKNIYNSVIEKLTHMDAEVKKEIAKKPDIRQNLWEGENAYRLPDAGVDNPVEFSIRTKGLGTYALKARIIVYEDDQSIDPHVQLWFWYNDGTEEGKKIPWERYDLQKSGRPDNFTLKQTLKDPQVTHLQGRLLNHTGQPGHWEKHAHVSNIIITYNTGQELPMR